MIRIIGGKYRHRQIVFPDNKDLIRPTKDRIRESFFNALGDISGKTFLDLYAGSGAVGFEALSRGCEKVYFNDHEKLSIDCISLTIEKLKINNSQYEVTLMSDFNALEVYKKSEKAFDIIFLDPPYAYENIEDVIKVIFENNLLVNSGILVIETMKDLKILDNYNFSKLKKYVYKDIIVYICWRQI